MAAPAGRGGLGTMSAPPADELGVPSGRVVTGHHDRGLLDECRLIGDLRRNRAQAVGLVDGTKVRREPRRPLDQALVELQPLRLVEGNRCGDAAPAAVNAVEPPAPPPALPHPHPIRAPPHSPRPYLLSE